MPMLAALAHCTASTGPSSVTLNNKGGRCTACYRKDSVAPTSSSSLSQQRLRPRYRAMPDPVEELQRRPKEAKQRFLAYLKDEIWALNFYRAHMLYFIIVIAVSSVIVYGEGVKNGPKELRDSHLSYMDALFLTCSAMTTTGRFRSRFTTVIKLTYCRVELGGSGRPLGLPTSSLVRLAYHRQHPFRLHGRGPDPSVHVPQAHVGSREALAHHAASCSGYRGQSANRPE